MKGEREQTVFAPDRLYAGTRGVRYYRGRYDMRIQVGKMTRIALLSAIGFVLFFLEIPIVAFYKLDISAFPALLAGCSMGPLAGFLVILLKILLHLPFSSTAGALYIGDIADLIMSSAFVIPVSMIYARHKTRRSALMGMGVGILCITVVGGLTNYFLIIPGYMSLMHFSEEAILGMAQKAIPAVDNFGKLIVCITMPFNILKGLVLSVVTLLTYKRLSPLLHPVYRQ
jgi:riboflavin transporter FmnP